MAKSRKKTTSQPRKKQRSAPKPATGKARRSPMSTAPAAVGGPVTLEQARALVQAPAPRRALRGPGAPVPAASPATVGAERKKLAREQRREQQQRIRDYKAMMNIMKERGVKGLGPKAKKGGPRRAAGAGPAGAPAAQPLQVFAEGDSWFDYPVPFFGGGIIPRLEKRLGVPILNLAKAGDEVRYMLGVKEREILAQQLTAGCPAGGPWDVLLFSGGGNDIVDNPMALWVRDYVANVPPATLINQPRFTIALGLVQAAYEDLITLRDNLSPNTQLVFHAYDFAIPDGRGVCFLGPWLKPTFDLRKFPVASTARFEVVKAMLQQFAAMLQKLAANKGVTFINGQGTLKPVPASWDNELHPSKDGFEKFAALFYTKLKALFPGRVL